MNKVYVVNYMPFEPGFGSKRDGELLVDGIFSSVYLWITETWSGVSLFKGYEIVPLYPLDYAHKAGVRKADVLTENDILLFTGGEDLGDNPDRDDFEKMVYEKYPHAIKIGICRGAQFLNVMNGGQLVKHINSDGHVLGFHKVDYSWSGSREHEYLLDDISHLTSTHHQGILPDPVKAEVYVACPNDGVVEAFCYKDTKCIGFQGHPEYLDAIGGSDTDKLFTRVCAASGLFN